MSTDDEALREAEAWFRENPDDVEMLTTGDPTLAGSCHAATIVREVLARDVPAPAGRDLTAQDVRDALDEHSEAGSLTAYNVADLLNRIARPSGGVGQTDTADRDDGSVCDECGAELLPEPPVADRSPRSWSLPAPPPEVTEALEWFHSAPEDTRSFLEWLHVRYMGEEWGALKHAASIVRWLLPVVEGEPPAPESEYAVSNWVRVPTTDGDTITVGALALDRRPHPDARWDTRTETWEPQAAESASVILFKPSGKYYTEERWVIPSDAIGPYDMDRSPDFRRINGGAVLIPSQEPWGYPHLFPTESER